MIKQMLYFFRFAASIHGVINRISIEYLLQYRASLDKNHESNLGQLRPFLRTWVILGLPGIDEEAISVLYSMRLKGNPKGEAVRTADIDRGPFTDTEFQAVIRAINDAFASSEISTEDYILIWLFMALGARPVQLATLKIGDFVVTRASDGTPTFLLRVPRAKQLLQKPRAELKNRKLVNEVGELIEGYCHTLRQRWRHLGLPDGAMPFFVDPENTEASPDLIYHCLAAELSRRVKTVFAVLRVVSEATPATALQMLKHLASLPDRLRANGEALLSSAQAQATTRRAQAMDQAEVYLTELDQWLSTAPQLLTEVDESGFHPGRYQCVEAPQPPTLATIEDEQIAYDLEEARRLLDGELPRVSDARPGGEQSEFDIFATRRPRTLPEHLAAAEEVLAEGVRTRAEAVKQHRRATAVAAQERSQAWQDAQQEQAREERRIAADNAQRALKAIKDAANNQALREWAIASEKPEIVKLLDDGAPAEQITDTLRSILFEPLVRFVGFKKIRKQDLLIANPNLDDKASGLNAVFDDAEVEFTDPGHQATVRAIVSASIEANISAQFAFRLHRGRLTRREETIGIPLEARSLLLTAHFGNLKISRAFAIGGLEPVVS